MLCYKNIVCREYCRSSFSKKNKCDSTVVTQKKEASLSIAIVLLARCSVRLRLGEDLS